MSAVASRGERRQAARRAPRGKLLALVSHTVRMQLRGVIIWGAALGLYSAALVVSFTAIEGSAGQLDQLMKAYPKGMLETFGVTDLGDPANYLHSQVFGFAPLALSFFPIMTLAGAIAGAEERGTIDVLLGNPLPRWQLVIGNFVATALSLLAIGGVVACSRGARPCSWTLSSPCGRGGPQPVAYMPRVRYSGAAVLGPLPPQGARRRHPRVPTLRHVPARHHRPGLRRPRRPATRIRLLLLRLGHRERHRLGGLWRHHPRGPRARAPGGARLRAAGHLHQGSWPPVITPRQAAPGAKVAGLWRAKTQRHC